jgi:hypothetical protein
MSASDGRFMCAFSGLSRCGAAVLTAEDACDASVDCRRHQCGAVYLPRRDQTYWGLDMNGWDRVLVLAGRVAGLALIALAEQLG